MSVVTNVKCHYQKNPAVLFFIPVSCWAEYQCFDLMWLGLCGPETSTHIFTHTNHTCMFTHVITKKYTKVYKLKYTMQGNKYGSISHSVWGAAPQYTFPQRFTLCVSTWLRWCVFTVVRQRSTYKMTEAGKRPTEKNTGELSLWLVPQSILGLDLTSDHCHRPAPLSPSFYCLNGALKQKSCTFWTVTCRL